MHDRLSLSCSEDTNVLVITGEDRRLIMILECKMFRATYDADIDIWYFSLKPNAFTVFSTNSLRFAEVMPRDKMLLKPTSALW